MSPLACDVIVLGDPAIFPRIIPKHTWVSEVTLHLNPVFNMLGKSSDPRS